VSRAERARLSLAGTLQMLARVRARVHRISSAFLGQLAWFSGSVLLSNAVLMLREGFLADLLGPRGFGTWQLLRLALGFTRYSDLGTMPGMSRQVPFHLGQGDEDGATFIRNVSWSATLIGSMSAGSLVTVTLLWQQPESVTTSVAVAVWLLIVAQQLHLFLALLQIAYGKLAQRGIQEVIASSSSLVLLVVLGRGNLEGAVFSVVLSFLISSAYVLLKLQPGLHLVLNAREVLRLIRIGLPVVFDGILTLAFKSIDRMYVLLFFDQQALGQYGIAIMAYSLFGTVFASVSNALLPQFSSRYGQAASVQELGSYFAKALLILCLLAPVPIGLVYLGLHLPVRIFLPEYIASIDATRISVLGTFFQVPFTCLRPFVISILEAPKMNRLLFLFVGLSVGVYPAIHSVRPDLAGISLSYLISFGTYTLAVALLVSGYTAPEVSKRRIVSSILVPFIYMVVLVLTVESIFPITPRSIASELLATTLRWFLFTAAYLPLILYAQNKTRILSHLWTLVR